MKIAVIGDTHFPFENPLLIDRCIDTIDDFQPDAVIQIGDLFDFCSFSNFPKDPSKLKMTPKEEVQLGRLSAEWMWKQIKSATKKGTKLYQLPGNHDLRLLKRLNEKVPEASFIGDEWFEKIMKFDGVQNVSDEFILDDIMFLHGYRPRGHHARWNQMNTVTGHIHVANIAYYMNKNGQYWEMNVGWLGDKSAYPFSYRWQKKIDDTHQGIGLIEDGQPRFIHF